MDKSCVEPNSTNLKMAIYKTGLTWTEIAKRVGVNKSSVSNWFRDRHGISDKNLKKLLTVLNEIQNEKGKIPYTLPYLRGETNCKILDNQKIYDMIYLKDEAIATLKEMGIKDIEENTLIPNTSPFTHISTFNYVISQKEFWEVLDIELGKSLNSNIRKIRSKYDNGMSIEECQDIIQSLDVDIPAEINATIKTILNNYMKELLGYYFPNE